MARVTKAQIEYAQRRLSREYREKTNKLQKNADYWVPPNEPTYEDIVSWAENCVNEPLHPDAVQRLRDFHWSASMMASAINAIVDLPKNSYMYVHNGYWTEEGEEIKKSLDEAYDYANDMIMLGDQEQMLNALEDFRTTA